MMRMVSSSPFSSSMRYTWTTSSTAPLYGSNGVPPLFASHDAILAEDCVGIVGNQRRSFERDATVLQLVDPVLFAVPFKPHRHTKCITFTLGSQRRHLRTVDAPIKRSLEHVGLERRVAASRVPSYPDLQVRNASTTESHRRSPDIC